MAIDLPDVVQRFRFDRSEIDQAILAAARLGSTLQQSGQQAQRSTQGLQQSTDQLGGQVQGTTRQYDRLLRVLAQNNVGQAASTRATQARTRAERDLRDQLARPVPAGGAGPDPQASRDSERAARELISTIHGLTPAQFEAVEAARELESAQQAVADATRDASTLLSDSTASVDERTDAETRLRAAVARRADAETAARQAARQAARAERAPVEADDSAARAARELVATLSGVTRAQFEVQESTRRLERAERELTAAQRDAADTLADARTSAAERTVVEESLRRAVLRRAAAENDARRAQEAARGGPAAGGGDDEAGRVGRLTGALQRLGQVGPGVASLMGDLKLAAIGGGATIAIGGVAALTGALTSFLGAVAPAGAAAGGFVAAVLAVKSVTAVGKLAVTDEVKKAAEVLADASSSAEDTRAALSTLPAPAREFARILAGIQSGPLADLRRTTQAELLPGLGAALSTAAELFPVVERGATGVARQLARLAVEGANMVTAGPFRADLAALADQNARTVGYLGNALLSGADAFRNIAAESIPFLDYLGRGVDTFAKFAQNAVAVNRANGDLALFFEHAAVAVDRLAGTAGNVGGIIRNIFSASNAAGGRGFLDTIEQATQRLQDFTGSIRGQRVIRDFFIDGQPAAREFGRLIRDVVGTLGRLGRVEGLEGLIRQIRTDLLPAVEGLAAGVTTRLGPALVEAATAFINFKNVLSFTPLIIAVEVLAKFVNAITDVIGAIPGMSTVVATLLLIGPTAKVAAAGLGVLRGALVTTFAVSAITNFQAGLAGMFGPATSRSGAFFQRVGRGFAAMRAAIGLTATSLVGLGAAFGVGAIIFGITKLVGHLRRVKEEAKEAGSEYAAAFIDRNTASTGGEVTARLQGVRAEIEKNKTAVREYEVAQKRLADLEYAASTSQYGGGAQLREARDAAAVARQGLIKDSVVATTAATKDLEQEEKALAAERSRSTAESIAAYKTLTGQTLSLPEGIKASTAEGQRLAEVLGNAASEAYRAVVQTGDLISIFNSADKTDTRGALQERQRQATAALADRFNAARRAATERGASEAEQAEIDRRERLEQDALERAQRAETKAAPAETTVFSSFVAGAERALTQAREFSADINTAVAQGYDPRLVADLAAKGPEAAGPILDGLVKNATSANLALFNNYADTLAKIAGTVAEQARLTAVATDAATGSAEKTGLLPLALRIQAAFNGGTTSVEGLAKKLGETPQQIQKVIDLFNQDYEFSVDTATARTQLDTLATNTTEALRRGLQEGTDSLDMRSVLERVNAYRKSIGQQPIEVPLKATDAELRAALDRARKEAAVPVGVKLRPEVAAANEAIRELVASAGKPIRPEVLVNARKALAEMNELRVAQGLEPIVVPADADAQKLIDAVTRAKAGIEAGVVMPVTIDGGLARAEMRRIADEVLKPGIKPVKADVAQALTQINALREAEGLKPIVVPASASVQDLLTAVRTAKEDLSKQPIGILFDVSQANQQILELAAAVTKPNTTPVAANIRAALDTINALRVAQGREPIVVPANAKTSQLQEAMRLARADASRPVTVPIGADTSAADKAIDAFRKRADFTTFSKHNVEVIEREIKRDAAAASRAAAPAAPPPPPRARETAAEAERRRERFARRNAIGGLMGIGGYTRHPSEAIFRAFAAGGVNELDRLPRQAVIQPPGTLVQWAEASTGGEAFIPLAPANRPRSLAILAEVAERFGAAVTLAGQALTSDPGVVGPDPVARGAQAAVAMATGGVTTPGTRSSSAPQQPVAPATPLGTLQQAATALLRAAGALSAVAARLAAGVGAGATGGTAGAGAVAAGASAAAAPVTGARRRTVAETNALTSRQREEREVTARRQREAREDLADRQRAENRAGQARRESQATRDARSRRQKDERDALADRQRAERGRQTDQQRVVRQQPVGAAAPLRLSTAAERFAAGQQPAPRINLPRVPLPAAVASGFTSGQAARAGVPPIRPAVSRAAIEAARQRQDPPAAVSRDGELARMLRQVIAELRGSRSPLDRARGQALAQQQAGLRPQVFHIGTVEDGDSLLRRARAADELLSLAEGGNSTQVGAFA